MNIYETLKKANSKEICVRFAVFCAEKALPVFEKEYPDDERPRLAIEAAKNWLKNQTEESRLMADAAAYAVYAAYAALDAAALDTAADAARAAADAAAYAAYAAYAAINAGVSRTEIEEYLRELLG